MSGNIPAPNERDLFRIVRGIRDLFEGRGNHTGQFTCTVDQASTAVAAPNCGADSKITLTPRHANAAAELAAGTIHVSAVAPGTFTVTHANSATTDRTFDYSIQG